MDDLYITDLIDQSILQEIQDAFSNMVGMAALTTDHEGKPVTKGSNFSDFCMKYTRKSEEGCKRCQECARNGAMQSQATGKATSYRCHAGLIDFAAPIVVNGKMIGSFTGGQVLTEKPDPVKIMEVAKEIGVDAIYQGAPTFSYKMDYFTVDREGALVLDDEDFGEEAERVLDAIAAAGFTAVQRACGSNRAEDKSVQPMARSILRV